MTKNAYSFYVDDYTAKLRSQKTPYLESDKYQLASPSWKKLSEIEREKYYQLARGNAKEKYNSQGIDMSSIHNKLLEVERNEANQNSEIKKTLKDCQDNGTLLDKNFFTMEINSYCELNNGDVVACEIAVSKFNLAEGISSDYYHCMIDIGEIPLGYNNTAQNRCRENGCPMPPVDFGEQDKLTILARLIQLVDPDVYPIYVMPKSIKIVENYLDQLATFAETNQVFRVYNLCKLFFRLRNLFGSDPRDNFPSEQFALSQLERDSNEYVTGLGCEHHENGEKYYMCVLARVKRLNFIICDYCCGPAGVELVPGKHLPKRALVGQTIKQAESTTPLKNNARQEPSPYRYEVPKPFINEAAMASSSCPPPVWEKPKPSTASAPPPAPGNVSNQPTTSQEHWPSLGGSSGAVRKRGGKK